MIASSNATATAAQRVPTWGGLNVIALQHGAETSTNPPATAELPRDGELVMLGTAAQHQAFAELFGT